MTGSVGFQLKRRLFAALLLCCLILAVSVPALTYAQETPVATPAPTEEQATPAPVTTENAPAPVTTAAPADNTAAPVTTAAPADNTAAPVTTVAPADNTAAPVATPPSAGLPLPTKPNLPVTTGLEENVDYEAADNLSAEEIQLLQSIQNGTLNDAQLVLIKKAASDAIALGIEQLYDRLEAKATRTQETRLFWVAVVFVGIIPLLIFITFLLYPFIIKKKIQERAPGATSGEAFKLYLPQAILVTLLIAGLGLALLGVQFLTVRVLGGVTNPQLVMQKQSLNYIYDNRDDLIEDYTQMFIGIADTIYEADPEKSVFDIILDNALQLKEDPAVRVANQIIEWVFPFLNYISLITFSLLLIFFLIRIRPDVMRMLTYPVEVLAAEKTGKVPPEFDSVAVGNIAPQQTAGETMRNITRKLMIVEIKVIALFALAVLAVALIMSFALTLFFYPIASMLVESFNIAAEYFLTAEGAGGVLVWSSFVLMLFVVECIVLFLISFIFVLIRLQDALRQRFAGKIDWKQLGVYMRRVGLRFAWFAFLLIILGVVLPYGVALYQNSVGDIPRPDVTTEIIALLGAPILLLVLLNLVMFLGRGFKMLVRIITKSVLSEFNLVKPEAKIEQAPAASA